ncbi:MAG TPA: type II toxin-antitoxin system VapC family toxin [Verrucomicrobiae bacterium]|nr:type II toxin-antitoxin system VapC family toxin [Verrucomicrobiae bacterium]
MIYLDTGCFVKLYYPETDSAKVIAVIRGKPICCTPLHNLESVNALQLKVFLKSATAAQVAAARALIEADLKTGVLLSVAADWKNVFAEAVTLAELHSSSLGCRSLDVLHCAAAKVLGASEFVSTDARQKSLATAMGLSFVTF